ncbi:hypothetical protein B0H12DRAFT_1243573 [Mycena haematopus]|nr:hypothetical protein B0H12DRAFT_1243573 [Mycena haematopus]
MPIPLPLVPPATYDDDFPFIISNPCLSKPPQLSLSGTYPPLNHPASVLGHPFQTPVEFYKAEKINWVSTLVRISFLQEWWQVNPNNYNARGWKAFQDWTGEPDTYDDTQHIFVNGIPQRLIDPESSQSFYAEMNPLVVYGVMRYLADFSKRSEKGDRLAEVVMSNFKRGILGNQENRWDDPWEE